MASDQPDGLQIDDWYDLVAPGKVIIPAVTPVLNLIPRRPPHADESSESDDWEAVLAFGHDAYHRTSADATMALVAYAHISRHSSFDTFCVASAPMSDAEFRDMHGEAPDHDPGSPGNHARRLAELLYIAKLREEGALVRGIIKQIMEAALDSAEYRLAALRTPMAFDGELTESDINGLLTRGHLEANADPQYLVCHPRVRTRIARLRGVDLGENADEAPLTYHNPATGVDMPVLADHYCPPDMLLALSLRWPYPVPQQPGEPIEVVCDPDYRGYVRPGAVDAQLQSQHSQPSYEVAARTSLRVHWLGGQLLLCGIDADS